MPAGSTLACPAKITALSTEIDALTPDAWDCAASQFLDLTYDQIARFSDGNWGAGRNSHLLLRRNGVVVAGARAAILTLPGLARGLAYVRFGPFWRRHDSNADPAAYRACVEAMVDEFCRRRGHCLTIIPRPNPDFHDRELAILQELGFVNRRPFRDRNRYLVNLDLTEDEQLKSLSQKWRYNLRRALRKGLDIRLCNDEDGIKAFLQLHISMAERKQFYDADPVHLLPELMNKLPAALRPQIVIAFDEGKPLVGAIISRLGDTAFYVFGASDQTALQHNAGYHLQWWIVRWLTKQKVRWYDLGGEALDAGLRQFKRGLVGSRGAIVEMEGEFDRWSDPRGRFVADAIYTARAAWRGVRTLRYGR